MLPNTPPSSAPTIDTLQALLQQILGETETLTQRLAVNATQVIVTQGLSDISQSLGIVTAGEFRAGKGTPGNPIDKFSGVRIVYPPLAYDLDSNGIPDAWFSIVGIKDNVLQFGLSNVDGKAYAGGGNVILDTAGITLKADVSDPIRWIYAIDGATGGIKCQTGSGLVIHNDADHTNVLDNTIMLKTDHGYIYINGAGYVQNGQNVDALMIGSGTVDIGRKSTTPQTYHIEFDGPTYTSTGGAKTINDATTLWISGPPIAGANVTITNARSLWVMGKSLFSSDVDVTGILSEYGNRVFSPNNLPSWSQIASKPGYVFVPLPTPAIPINAGTLTALYVATLTPAQMGASGLVPKAYAIRISNKWTTIASSAWMSTAASSSDTQGAVNLYPQNTTIGIENSGICPADGSGQIRVTGGSTAGASGTCFLLCYGYFI